MNQKITFPELVAALSNMTGCSKHVCEEFLKEFFTTISSTLVAGENVKIKKLGTFKILEVEARKSVKVGTGEEFEIPGHKKISFTPDKELAEAVNLPFSAFETVEIKDTVSDEMLESTENYIDNPSSQNNSSNNTKPQSNEAENIVIPTAPLTNRNDDSDESENETTQQTKVGNNPPNESRQEIPVDTQSAYDNEQSEYKSVGSDESAPDTVQQGETLSENSVETSNENNVENNTDEIVSETETDDDYDNISPIKRDRFIPGFILGMLATIALVVGGFFGMKHFCPSMFIQERIVNATIIENPTDTFSTALDSIDNDTAKLTIKETDTSKEELQNLANTRPSDIKVVYDTISLTRFLTTMAREHYGNYHLWPYIYEENKDILGHPDRIRPGTRVVIPPTSKYGIDPNDKECIAKAKRKGVEIYNRYNK